MLNKVSMAWAGLLNMGVCFIAASYRTQVPAIRAQAATETVAGGV